MLDIRNGKVEAELKVIVKRNRTIGPVICLVVSAGLAFENATFAIGRTVIPAVKIGQCIGVVCVLVKTGILIDMIACLLFIPCCRNRLQHMTHIQLILVELLGRLHPPLLDEPQLQRCRPG